MYRCALPVTALAIFIGSASPGFAQAQRNFPPTALRGELRVTQPPEVLLNGQGARLAPGARIRDANNLLALSGTLVGPSRVVNYTLDLQGHVLDVWVLTDTERSRQPWPATPAQALAWTFDAAAQTWSRP